MTYYEKLVSPGKEYKGVLSIILQLFCNCEIISKLEVEKKKKKAGRTHIVLRNVCP